jgi:hypothetical protein
MKLKYILLVIIAVTFFKNSIQAQDKVFDSVAYIEDYLGLKLVNSDCNDGAKITGVSNGGLFQKIKLIKPRTHEEYNGEVIGLDIHVLIGPWTAIKIRNPIELTRGILKIRSTNPDEKLKIVLLLYSCVKSNSDVYTGVANAKMDIGDLNIKKANLSNFILDTVDLNISDSFKIIANNYKNMKVKPEISEEARKYMVQANSATDEKRYDDAIALFKKAEDIQQAIPLAHFTEHYYSV